MTNLRLICVMLGSGVLPKPTTLAIPFARQCSDRQTQLHRVCFWKQFQSPRKLVVYAKNQTNGDENRISKESDQSNGEGDENQQAPFFNVRWVELLLDRDPDNVLAVGLTGLLTWASVQVVWQLLIVSLAIVVAALKYSFVAALLIFILVALL